VGGEDDHRAVQAEAEEMRVLFIPGNIYHVRIFSNVYRKLRAEVVALSLEPYREKGRAGIERALAERGIPFRRVTDYRRSNPGFILEMERPDVVVVMNDVDPDCFPFVDEANRRGVPTLLIAEGISFGEPPRVSGPAFPVRVVRNVIGSGNPAHTARVLFRKVAARISGLRWPDYNEYGMSCSWIAVWGEYSKEQFAGRGVASARIEVTGNPLFDDLAGGKFDPEGVRRGLGMRAGERLAVYASCSPVDIGWWTKDEVRRTVLAVRGAVEEIPGCRLVVRPHPTEREEVYREYLGGETKRVRVSKAEMLYDLLSACDILITEASVVGFEAAVMGRPVVIVNLTGKPQLIRDYPALLVKEGVALEARSEGELRGCISGVLLGGEAEGMGRNRGRFIERYCYRLDGRSSERVANLIERMAGGV
jgi:glycosyltransferase involved in cell wall biosynthesis